MRPRRRRVPPRLDGGGQRPVRAPGQLTSDWAWRAPEGGYLNCRQPDTRSTHRSQCSSHGSARERLAFQGSVGDLLSLGYATAISELDFLRRRYQNAPNSPTKGSDL